MRNTERNFIYKRYDQMSYNEDQKSQDLYRDTKLC